MNIKGTLFIVSAPSGAGKTALVLAVIAKMAPFTAIKRVVTYTCRQPRTGEIDGQDYHFITPDDFEQKIQQGFFLEWSQSYGTYYGSPKSLIQDLEAGMCLLMIMDKAGMATMAQCMPQSIRIGIEVGSLDVLKARLIARNTEALGQIEKRLTLAHTESLENEHALSCHYIIKNDHFQTAVEDFEQIIRSYIKQSSHSDNADQIDLK